MHVPPHMRFEARRAQTLASLPCRLRERRCHLVSTWEVPSRVRLLSWLSAPGGSASTMCLPRRHQVAPLAGPPSACLPPGHFRVPAREAWQTFLGMLLTDGPPQAQTGGLQCQLMAPQAPADQPG